MATNSTSKYSSILAAALDLDGTIIGPDEKITPAVRDAIIQLSKKLPRYLVEL